MKAVAIVSGGLDSVTLAYFLKNQGYDLNMLSVNYGQRHKTELSFAALAGRALGADWRLLDLSQSGLTDLLAGSSLTSSEMAVPEGHYASEGMKSTVVPNRNSILLAMAYGWAVSSHAEIVATAVHAGDHAIYPDCRPEFIQAFETAEMLGNEWAEPLPAISAPFLNKSKADIVRLGVAVGVPFDKTWSCYQGGHKHCGRCGTDWERQEAFYLAGVHDPTEYLDPVSQEELKAGRPATLA